MRLVLALVLSVAAVLAACQGSPDASPHPSSQPPSSEHASSENRPSDPERCASCHADDFRGATAPVHVGTRPDTCAICHSQDAWRPTISNHPWPLTGAHAKASCFACHKGDVSQFRSTKKECVACHRKEYDKAPNHVAKKFSTKCEACHQTDEWSDRLGVPLRP